MAKTYLYYGTEENCFEIEKHETSNPFEDIRNFLTDDYVDEDEINAAVKQMKSDFDENGFALYETTQGQGYEIVIGIANNGKCSEVRRVLEIRRKELISMW